MKSDKNTTTKSNIGTNKPKRVFKHWAFEHWAKTGEITEEFLTRFRDRCEHFHRIYHLRIDVGYVYCECLEKLYNRMREKVFDPSKNSGSKTPGSTFVSQLILDVVRSVQKKKRVTGAYNPHRRLKKYDSNLRKLLLKVHKEMRKYGLYFDINAFYRNVIYGYYIRL